MTTCFIHSYTSATKLELEKEMIQKRRENLLAIYIRVTNNSI